MKSNTPSVITILVLTLITALTWIGFSVYRALEIKPKPEVAETIISPLSPVLNEEVIERIRNKVFIPKDEQIQSFIPQETSEPTNAPLPTQ